MQGCAAPSSTVFADCIPWPPDLASHVHAQVVLCAIRPSFQPVATLPVAGSCGLEWGMRQVGALGWSLAVPRANLSSRL